MEMNQTLLYYFLVRWTSTNYQIFWCEQIQGFDSYPCKCRENRYQHLFRIGLMLKLKYSAKKQQHSRQNLVWVRFLNRFGYGFGPRPGNPLGRPSHRVATYFAPGTVPGNGWVAGGCWDDDITNVMMAGSFPKIPCVKRTSKKSFALNSSIHSPSEFSHRFRLRFQTVWPSISLQATGDSPARFLHNISCPIYHSIHWLTVFPSKLAPTIADTYSYVNMAGMYCLCGQAKPVVIVVPPS